MLKRLWRKNDAGKLFARGHLKTINSVSPALFRYFCNQTGRKPVHTTILKLANYITINLSEMANEFTDASFQTEVLGSEKVTVVDFWAEWCGPCKMMNPVLEELAVEYAGKAVIGKLNVDDNPEIPMNYNVRGIPTFLIFKNGELKDKIVGATTKQALKDRIDAIV